MDILCLEKRGLGMGYDLKEIENILKIADQMIKENPDLLTKTTDEIFDELDNGTSEMRHNRWGVMVRAAMTRLAGTEMKEILAFLYTIKENNLLCEYVGYILQQELHINLLELVIYKDQIDLVWNYLKNKKILLVKSFFFIIMKIIL